MIIQLRIYNLRYHIDLIGTWRSRPVMLGPNYHLLNFHTSKPPPPHRLSLPVNRFQCSHRAESGNEPKHVHRPLKLVHVLAFRFNLILRMMGGNFFS